MPFLKKKYLYHGISNVYKYSESYSGTGEVIFEENDVFTCKVPLTNNNVTDNVTDNRLDEILKLIKKDNKISTIELSKVLKVTRRTILRDIEKLKLNSKLQRVGSEKSGYWKIIN